MVAPFLSQVARMIEEGWIFVCIRPDRRVDDQLIQYILASYGEKTYREFAHTGRLLQSQSSLWVRTPKYDYPGYALAHSWASEVEALSEFSTRARINSEKVVKRPKKGRFALLASRILNTQRKP